MKFKSIFLMLIFSSSVTSAERQQFERRLIESCREAVGLFKSSTNEDRKTLKLTINQSFATSNSDALQIGYCKGVIDTIMQMQPYCRKENWFQIAERLIEQKDSQRKMIEFIKNEC